MSTRLVLVGLGFVGITLRILASRGRERAGWCLLGLPLAIAPATQWLIPDDLSGRGDFVQGLQPVDLVLEITERQLPDDFAALADMLGRLRIEGYRVAIDDFGAGYSALAQLSRLSFDLLKLDSAFTDDLPVGVDLIGLVVELCHGRGAQVVAEGVEVAEQLAQLRATSCDLGQGYLWLRPQRIDEMTAIDDLRAVAAGSAGGPAPGTRGALSHGAGRRPLR